MGTLEYSAAQLPPDNISWGEPWYVVVLPPATKSKSKSHEAQLPAPSVALLMRRHLESSFMVPSALQATMSG